MLVKKIVINAFATLIVVVLVNALAVFWAKIFFSYGNLEISETFIDGLEDRRYIEYKLLNEGLIILELNKNKTELMSVMFYSPSRDWTFFFDEQTGSYTVETKGRTGFYNHDQFLPTGYIDGSKKNAFSFNQQLEPVWLEVWSEAQGEIEDKRKP